MPEELVTRRVGLAGTELRLLQPRESAEFPDSGGVEWAPIAPYWSVLWRSGVALAREVEGAVPRGSRVVELGCGLALPSFAAARAGARVLATDSSAEAIALVEINARANEVRLETAKVDWSNPDGLLKRGKCDLVLAADVLYERASVGQLLALLPRLAPEVWLADPGRSGSEEFLEMARGRWSIDTGARGLISVHRLRLHGSLGAIS